MRVISLLGSSGSIGRQTLDVCRRHPDKLRVESLSVNSNVAMLLDQAAEFGVRQAAVADSSKKDSPEAAQMREMGVDVGFGPSAIEELAVSDGTDCVVNALVGAAGLAASHAALQAGKRLALANKESLVVGGDLLMPLARQARGGSQLLPIDSEHGAIFQCLVGESAQEVSRLWVTASGGPFFGKTREELEHVTCSQALSHPTWNMGPKITIDSATLMNKGLEVIEAHHLFNMDFERISVVVHRQSCIHSMVEYVDGSVKAHMGVTDMRIPIQYALSYPERWESVCEPLDLTALADLTFAAPDLDVFPCLALALEAGRESGTAPAVMNAANEVAVAAFLDGACSFTSIDQTVRQTLEKFDFERVESLEQLSEVDSRAREAARSCLSIR